MTSNVLISYGVNYLSHYYFSSPSEPPCLIAGLLLPDLVKVHNKNWVVSPEKHLDGLQKEDMLMQCLYGWRRHKKVDQLFHASSFFATHTAVLGPLIRPLLAGTRIWPSLVAHIMLELMLDSLLLMDKRIDVGRLYGTLSSADNDKIVLFLTSCGINDAFTFIPFFNQFIARKYLFNYSQDDQIVDAMRHVFSRVWPATWDIDASAGLIDLARDYKQSLKNSYLDVFADIANILQNR